MCLPAYVPALIVETLYTYRILIIIDSYTYLQIVFECPQALSLKYLLKELAL